MNRHGDNWDNDLLQSLNINSEAIIINQCPEMNKTVKEYVTFYNNSKVTVVNEKNRGIGRSRNTGLLKLPSECEYVLFADDDITYVDNYTYLIERYFNVLNCDMLIFNTDVKENGEAKRVKEKQNKTIKKVHWFDCLRYGAVRIAIKKEFLDTHNIWYSLEHGGGAKYQYGEDSLFIHDCLKAGAIIYTVPETLCSFNYDTSSWFNGYDENFFYDMGVLFYKLFNSHGKPSLKGKLFLYVMVTKNKDKLKTVHRNVALKKAMEGYTHIRTHHY